MLIICSSGMRHSIPPPPPNTLYRYIPETAISMASTAKRTAIKICSVTEFVRRIILFVVYFPASCTSIFFSISPFLFSFSFLFSSPHIIASLTTTTAHNGTGTTNFPPNIICMLRFLYARTHSLSLSPTLFCAIQLKTFSIYSPCICFKWRAQKSVFLANLNVKIKLFYTYEVDEI